MRDLLTALALVLVIEGALWCLAPGLMRRVIERAATSDPGTLRVGGLMFAVIGVVCVWLIRG
jgi:uncharacterized protein